jgi:large subunit ribosomal protein L25
MKLNINKRVMPKKSESKKIRSEGNIPAIVYVRGKESETITVNGVEFTAHLRKVQSGRLSTTVFELLEDKVKPRKAILKDIHYDPVSYNVIHLDFEELLDDAKVNVKIPIEFTGVAECVGVKLGGIIRQVIRQLRVRCLPKDMPLVFQMDVKNLGLWEAKRLSDLELPPTVQPLADLNEVAVTIAKR